MKASQLREQTDEELRSTCADLSKQLVDLRVRRHTGDSSEQPLRIRTLRREIARVKTLIGERETNKNG